MEEVDKEVYYPISIAIYLRNQIAGKLDFVRASFLFLDNKKKVRTFNFSRVKIAALELRKKRAFYDLRNFLMDRVFMVPSTFSRCAIYYGEQNR